MSKNEKTAVMYGAGNIGRGFIGQVFRDSGFEVVFIDIDNDVVSALNKRNSYTQLIIDGEKTKRREITGVRAVDGRNRTAVSKEISGCDIMAVSVGAAVLPHIALFIADGLEIRSKPLNILVCENLAHAPSVLRDYVSEYLSEPLKLSNVGFVGTTIGRMVPVMPSELRTVDPTLIAVEPFCTLPIDGDSVVQPMPEIYHTILCSPFAFEEGKKLFIHNMGHAIAAYFGYLKDYKFIWQAMKDDSISSKVYDAMVATAEALACKFNENKENLTDYVNDLLSRFCNKGLGDKIARVGGDPLRKLAPGDRLMGAIDLCREQGINYSPILSGISAALRFNAPDDPSSDMLRANLKEKGITSFLKEFCGLSESDALMCADIYHHAS